MLVLTETLVYCFLHQVTFFAFLNAVIYLYMESSKDFYDS